MSEDDRAPIQVLEEVERECYHCEGVGTENFPTNNPLKPRKTGPCRMCKGKKTTMRPNFRNPTADEVMALLRWAVEERIT